MVVLTVAPVTHPSCRNVRWPQASTLPAAATAGISGFRFVGTALTADAEFFQDDFRRTKVRERGLEQAEADERREPEPIVAVKVRKQQAQQYQATGQHSDVPFDGHLICPFNCYAQQMLRATSAPTIMP
jgi:hypothetical protein